MKLQVLGSVLMFFLTSTLTPLQGVFWPYKVRMEDKPWSSNMWSLLVVLKALLSCSDLLLLLLVVVAVVFLFLLLLLLLNKLPKTKLAEHKFDPVFFRIWTWWTCLQMLQPSVNGLSRDCQVTSSLFKTVSSSLRHPVILSLSIPRWDTGSYFPVIKQSWDQTVAGI